MMSCIWEIYQFLRNQYYELRGLSTTLRTGSHYRVAAVDAHDSRLAFSTFNIHRICKYVTYAESPFSMLGLDSHADISCAGRDAYILAQSEGRTCTVHPFNDSYDPMTGIKIINVLYKYINTEGDEYILEVNQCLDFTDTMIHSILCTNQARHIGIIVNDVPKVCDANSPQEIRTNDGKTTMPLEMNGPIPYIPITKPSLNDVEYLPRIKLTSDDIEWDPHKIFNEPRPNEYKYLERDFDISYNIQGINLLREIVQTHTTRVAAIAHANDGKFKANDIANLWGIGSKAAERTLKATTQLSTRHLNGKIHRRVRTRMHQRRYR